jgi:uncharacterized protein YndB with AHSA1/START domain
MKEAVLDDLLIQIDQTVEIKATPEKVFEGLVSHLCELPGEEGKPAVKLKLERWPGGRWFRDLENGNGHLWGFVQSIKPPTLLEVFGPLMLSYPVSTHLIVRLSPINGGTKLVFQNQIFGPVPPEARGMEEGWKQMLEHLKRSLER